LGNYLAYAISNFPLKQSLANLAKGVNILHLANKDLRRLALPIPPIAEQVKIIKKVEEHQAGIEKLKNSVVDLEGKIANTILEIWS
jgi:restriction endonuclease S subunit